MAAAVVRIPARFNGPPESGHGGYSAGTFAALVGKGPAAVSLRAPPPLETDLEVVRTGEAVEVRDGRTLIASVAAAEPVAPPPPPLRPEVAATATLHPDELARRHPFPTCFGCGPLRSPGEGLRLFAGPVTDRDGDFGADWVPDPSLAGPDGHVRDVYVWAALDCPSGAPASDRTGASPIVLARLCVALEGPVRAREPHAVVSRAVRRDGRKRETAIALYDADGRRVARGEALWIAVPSDEDG